MFHAQVTILSLLLTVEHGLVDYIIPRTCFVVVQATYELSFRLSPNHP